MHGYMNSPANRTAPPPTCCSVLQQPIAHVRFVAVSATVPNVADIGQWLGVPPAGLKQYGEELRPVKLKTLVKGYAPSKNDFLFERRLSEYVFGLVMEHSARKPTLVFCR